MPPLPSSPGYYNAAVFGTADSLHTVGDSATKLKFLTDYIDVGYSILSIGDVLIHTFVFIVVYSVIQELNSVETEKIQ